MFFSKSLWMLAMSALPVSCSNLSCSKKFTREHLLVESFFEGSDPFDGWENNQHCCDYSLTQSTKAAEGTGSLRLEVRSADPQVSGSIRSELVQPPEKEGAERWYGFKMYLENWTDDQAREHVLQWHPEDPSGSAVGSLFTSGGRYEFVTTHFSGTNGNGYSDLGPIINNQWVSWVMHIKWASSRTGIIQIWQNGKLVLDIKNTRTSPDMGSYFKLGINKFGWGIDPSATTQRVLYFDEVRIGNDLASYDDVKPRS
jgi:hypothetical protein